MTPVSRRWRANDAIPVARAYGLAGDNQAAIDTLRKNYSTLPQPAGDLALALAFAASGDSMNAVVYHQRVYYGFPMSAEAAQSDAALTKLRADLGDQYPPAMPNAMLGRAVKLTEAKQYSKARAELDTLVLRCWAGWKKFVSGSRGGGGLSVEGYRSGHMARK